MPPVEIIIIGGGIGGLALASALQRAGRRIVVCERASELREIGAGILLTPNASWVLHRLGLLEKASAVGLIVTSWRILDARGRLLQTFQVGTEQAPSLSLTRTALQQLLQEQLSPGTLWLGHEAVSIEADHPRGTATVHFSHGETLTAQLIVGADGGKSMLRRHVAGDSPPRGCGYVGWRALVDWIPPNSPEGRVSESWAKGSRFGIAPVGAGRCYWYATENGSADVPPGRRKEHLLRKFQGWHDPICRLIDATPEESILFTPIGDLPPLKSWHRGSTVLIGDAAHLMTPNLGQGAAMALEDAWELSRCVAEESTSERAILSYQRRRRRRTAMVVWLSRQVGRMIQLEQPLLWRLRNAMLKLTPDFLGRAALSPVFNFRV